MPENTGGGTVKKKKGTGVLIFFLILIIAALIIAVVFLLGKNKDNKNGSLSVDTSHSDSAEKRNVVVNKDNVEQLIEQLAEEDKTPVGRYQVSMTTDWHFADGESVSGDAYVENVEANTNDVYFDILLADTEEKIYSSPVIPVGSYLKNIQLDKNLPDGTYDCVIVYSLIDEEQNVLSEVRLTLEINVGE